MSNDDIGKCDIVVSIPASQNYPVMNLSHAVAIILYELSIPQPEKIELAKRSDLELLYVHCQQVLERICYPEHKRNKTFMMLRRIFGRAQLTGREVQTFRGISRSVEWRIRNKDH